MRIRRFVSGVVVAAIAATMLALTAPSASALTSAEYQFVKLINHERAIRGKQSLSIADDLVASARHHSGLMAAKGEIFHNMNLANEIDNWFVIGENVGVGPSVERLHEAFMNSPHHKENILYSDYNRIGIGIKFGDDGYMYVTEVFAGRHSTSTVSATNTSTASHKVSRSTTAATSTATSAPVAPKIRRAAPKPAPQTVDLLVRMVGLDAASVDPSTGAASS